MVIKNNTLERNPITLIFIMELYKIHVSYIFLPNYLFMEISIFKIFFSFFTNIDEQN